MRCRRAEDVVVRKVAVGQVLPPEQLVVAVVVRVRAEPEEERQDQQSGESGGYCGVPSRGKRVGPGGGARAASACRRFCERHVGAGQRPATIARRMKLIIQIPCLNEEEQLPATLADLPRAVPGFEEVEWLIIDDGSTDRTIEVARQHGVDHVVRLTNNKGLAAAFQAGIDACLKLGADVIVNTDADNQYDAADIPKLVEPIVRGDADLEVGDRVIGSIEHFSPLKKRLQHFGSAVVRRASGTDVPDTTSGFRAYNREAALQVTVVSKYTYTLESVIQAGKMLVAVDHTPVRARRVDRPSRLFGHSMWGYVRRNALAIFRIYSMYEPLRVFMTAAIIVGLAAAAIWIRYLIILIEGHGSGHLQSVIVGAVLVIAAVQLAALGVMGDILAGMRTLQQRTLERGRRVELQLGVQPSHYEPGEAKAAAEPTTGVEAGPATGKPDRETVGL